MKERRGQLRPELANLGEWWCSAQAGGGSSVLIPEGNDRKAALHSEVAVAKEHR